ncbi:MAG TPA: hypothetical protein PK753_11730 [Ignavibacteria bacterium]|nr:hypothetical protein [Ignavibacteria bacterium]
MINSSAAGLLRTFTKTEIKKFDRFVNSAYFNRKSAISRLWTEIKHFAPEFDSPRLTGENIYSKIYPGKKFNYGTMKNIIHELMVLAKKFIELEHYNSKKIRGNFNLLEVILERRLHGLFEKTFKETRQSIEKNTYDPDYYKNKFYLNSLKQNHLIQQDKYYDTAASSELGNLNITMGYFVDVFHNNYNQLLIQTELNAGMDNGFMKKVLAFYNSVPVKFDFRVRIFYHAIMLIYEGSSVHFYQMNKLVKENSSRLSHGEKYNFLVALSGYCYIKFEEGSNEFLKNEFEIYKYMIENGIYNFENKQNIDGPFYRNAALSALKNNEIQWALNFINEFRYKLNIKVREHYYLHALIEYNIGVKNFEQALKYLSKIKHSMIIDKIQIKKWELIVNYEMSGFNELAYIIDSAKHFIYNDSKLNHSKKEKLNTFVQLIGKMADLKLNKVKGIFPDEKIYSLKKEINSLNDGSKFWLIEKILEMEKEK